jgi:phosphotransferase family enzyme
VAGLSATSTHHIAVDGEVVTKVYRSWERGEPAREWRALGLLERYAPGLAARPLGSDLEGHPPSITMTRLPGAPLRALLVSGVPDPDRKWLEVVAGAVVRLHGAVPAAVVREVPEASWNLKVAVAKARRARAQLPDLGRDPVVVAALERGAAWVDGPALEGLLAGTEQPVLGLTDGNLDNYLWNETSGRISLVDFEDSGRTDRLFEVAELVEHIGTRAHDVLDAAAFLSLVGLSAGEAGRLQEMRRLLAFIWLTLLYPGGPACLRNPEGTLERQAAHLLDLLG